MWSVGWRLHRPWPEKTAEDGVLGGAPWSEENRPDKVMRMALRFTGFATGEARRVTVRVRVVVEHQTTHYGGRRSCRGGEGGGTLTTCYGGRRQSPWRRGDRESAGKPVTGEDDDDQGCLRLKTKGKSEWRGDRWLWWFVVELPKKQKSGGGSHEDDDYGGGAWWWRTEKWEDGGGWWSVWWLNRNRPEIMVLWLVDSRRRRCEYVNAAGKYKWELGFRKLTFSVLAISLIEQLVCSSLFNHVLSFKVSKVSPSS
jgi:hypothetical protein